MTPCDLSDRETYTKHFPLIFEKILLDDAIQLGSDVMISETFYRGETQEVTNWMRIASKKYFKHLYCGFDRFYNKIGATDLNVSMLICNLEILDCHWKRKVNLYSISRIKGQTNSESKE